MKALERLGEACQELRIRIKAEVRIEIIHIGAIRVPLSSSQQRRRRRAAVKARQAGRRIRFGTREVAPFGQRDDDRLQLESLLGEQVFRLLAGGSRLSTLHEAGRNETLQNAWQGCSWRFPGSRAAMRRAPSSISMG